MRKITIVRYTKDGRQVPKATPGAVKSRCKSKKWYGDVPGRNSPVPLSTNKAVSAQMLGKLLEQAERKRCGVAVPGEDWCDVPLDGQLPAFRAHVEAGRGKRRPKSRAVGEVISRLERMLSGCGFAYARDITLAAAQEHLAGIVAGEEVIVPQRDLFRVGEVAGLFGVTESTVQRTTLAKGLPRVGGGHTTRYPRATVLALAADRRGIGLAALKEHARAARRFTRWLWESGRAPCDPLAGLTASAPEGGSHRHDRRPLSEAEVERFLATVRASPRVFRGLTGQDRWALYLTAMSTGFRRGELAELTPARFLLDHTPPVVLLAEAETKNDRGAVQPLPAEVVGPLRDYLSDREPHRPVWPGRWPEANTHMQRADLADAGIPYRTDGPDGPLFADMHALRHTFCAMLKRSGATLSQAMRLMRHGDPRLTIALYGREDLGELSEAVSRVHLVAGPVAGHRASKGEANAVDASRCEDAPTGHKAANRKGNGAKPRGSR